MSTLRPADVHPADGIATRDLDRHLIGRSGVIVDAGALVQLPAGRRCGADPFLLASGAPVSATVPAPLVRLLMRAGSMAVPCALVTERLGRHVSDMLTAQRVPPVWSASVGAAEHRDRGTNPYRAAARALRLPVEGCLVIAAELTLREARASSARRVLLAEFGSLRTVSKTVNGLSQRQHDVALQLALGNTYDGVAALLGCSASTASNHMSQVMRRRGRTDRTRAIVDLITSGSLDAAVLRAALPDRLPELDPIGHEVLALLASHEVRAVARMTGLNPDTIGRVILRATHALGAKTRTHAVVMVLLLGRPGPVAADGAR
ncbi:LuxR C-terminal-related transcriptional regulator [Kitasatospora sp. NPDC091335]|uniref:LuxR C-terminal-related transcriptional regulator n=1 Tax=Kitasatospora sp. NPDC091335 TaxID=3364085 RepID=UPI0037F41578